MTWSRDLANHQQQSSYRRDARNEKSMLIKWRCTSLRLLALQSEFWWHLESFFNFLKVQAPIGHIRYVNTQAWLRGFRVKIAKFSSFFCSLSSHKRLRYKRNNTKYRSLTWKPRGHVRILIYRTWPLKTSSTADHRPQNMQFCYFLRALFIFAVHFVSWLFFVIDKVMWLSCKEPFNICLIFFISINYVHVNKSFVLMERLCISFFICRVERCLRCPENR